MGTKLKHAIKRSGYLQNWIAEQAGIGVSLLSRYARGHKQLTPAHRRALAEVLRVNETELEETEMVVGRLRMTVVVEWDVRDLKHYEASTIEEAAVNQQRWLDDGVHLSVENIVHFAELMAAKIEVADGATTQDDS